MGETAPTKDEVLAAVAAAFRGVRLGDGVGLWQGQAIDDYAGSAAIAKARERDEKDDWTKLTGEDLSRCYSSLSFFDADGMRFHLPAFITGHLNGTVNVDPIFHLTSDEAFATSKLASLSPAQRAAVRLYLAYFAESTKADD